MKLGLIARADNSGLGMQTWEFYRHMHPSKTMVVDISKYNNNKTYPERYPDGITCKGFPTPAMIDMFLQDLDVVFVAEAPYNYYLYERARQLGIKTAVQYNYEFFDWFVHPEYPKPDMLIAPSNWHYKEIDQFCQDEGITHLYLHCPVNRQALPQRVIKRARTFLHIAGRSAAHDRNGTETVIIASRYLETPAKIVCHFQGEQGLPHQATFTIDDYRRMLGEQGDPDKLTIVQQEFTDYSDVYAMGDVLVLPRRYGGNCLPMNEALSVGMPVIMTNTSPNSSFLPKGWLVTAEIVSSFTPRTKIDIYQADARALARKIDQFYMMTESQMWFENVTAGKLADAISWSALRQYYQTALEELCTQ